ncbi:MAG: hypothetical protein KKA79_05910 [Nanoarchaeota archaeon]|nr:hypothetical protein [Nanoarchaeota archaeon]MCG2718995.1 hypothetical protein [Nanoarchaeota archaeon]
MNEYETSIVKDMQNHVDYCKWIKDEIRNLAKVDIEAAKYNAITCIARLDRLPTQETDAFQDLLDDPVGYLDRIIEDKDLESKLIEEISEMAGGW